MVHHTDKTYIETEMVLAGKKEIDPKLKELSEWISSEFKVEVINLSVDYLNHLSKERLQIITRTNQEAWKFKEAQEWFGNYDSKKQEAVAQKYLEIVKEDLTSNDDYPASKKLFVCSTAFNPIARQATISKIKGRELEEFKRKINLVELWEIKTDFGEPIVFFFTDEQVESFRNTDSFERLKVMFYNNVKKHDLYNLFEEKNFNINLDSKENFDNNYESRWQYYYN